ncbi:MFS general substrate transporter [Teratosphaeria nubilosa]|uniref:MFS general substrate transporter n=1 Tax=Teratosphaeria nubilosa TaxID=161662 RepID=A0A6G1LMW6_9PEZI|nr:MFS general substrate transporter [Teratosphaeria nubilosa]
MGLTELPPPRSSLARFYRSTWFNVVIVGLVSFTQPGIWTALNNTGAGGEEKPYLVNAANALTYGLMAVCSPLFGAVANRIGLKYTLIIGVIGYTPYSASLYCNNRFGNEWFVYLGAALCGIGASALWCSDAAIAVGYPLAHERGLATGIWLALRGLGSIIGGAIELGLNHTQKTTGKVGYSTYLALIAIECMGLPLALMVSSPHNALRSDGTRVNSIHVRPLSVKQGLQALWPLFKQPRVYLLLPILTTIWWNPTYLSIYLTNNFSVRSRALASLVSSLAGSFADVAVGRMLDIKSVRRSSLARYTWSTFVLIMLALFSWQVANEHLYSHTKPTLDWATPGFGRGFAVNVLFNAMNEANSTFAFWIIGTFSEDLQWITQVFGLMRSAETIGAAIACALGGSQNVSPMTNLIVAFAVYAAAFPFAFVAVWQVPDNPTETVLLEGRDGQGVAVAAVKAGAP